MNLGQLLVFIPGLVNFLVILYMLSHTKSYKGANLFLLFQTALLFWQVEEFFLRQTGLSYAYAVALDQMFSMGWLALGALLLHFVIDFLQLPQAKNRVILALIWLPYFVFFGLYQANPQPNAFNQHEIWGYTLAIRPDSTDLIQRLWLVTLVFIAIGLLIYHYALKQTDKIKKKQIGLLLLGLAFPVSVGFVFQIIFPFIGLPDIPLTSMGMLFFTVIAFYALTKYQLFDPNQEVQAGEVLDQMLSAILIVDLNGHILYLNHRAMALFGEFPQQKPALDALFTLSIPIERFLSLGWSGAQSKENLKDVEFFNMRHQKRYAVEAVPLFKHNKQEKLLLVLKDRVEEEQALLEVERLTQVMAEDKGTAFQLFWELDLQQQQVIWGNSFHILFSFPSEFKPNRLDEAFYGIVCPEDRLMLKRNSQRAWEGLASGANTWEFGLLNHNGDKIRVREHFFVIRDTHNQPKKCFGTLSIIDEAWNPAALAEKRGEQLKKIAWTQSHLVRAPLAKVMALSDLLATAYEEDPEQVKFYVEALQESAEELDQIIRQIIADSHGEKVA
ncbi:PAS domain-containing protein [Nitritalea halalkaliphila LW7]|uniref:PAS domain-containing protein n=1 Tax=Nitritalea halalkaliphila LW7 TaxID=1189621 RepID=I5CAM1_9BACT|nr:histidine kinase N-terminal 7TM domain-containing protein [Nitritalea halalkaliphila]EIM78873.1 PAS domain-containing protein [Nitritalea halalkaliphila LW7]